MLSTGPARKVTIFLNEDTPHHLGTLADAVLDFLHRKGVAGATMTRGVAGFGAHHQIHTEKVEVAAGGFPLRIEFVESQARADELLPALYDLVDDGLVEVQDTTVVRAARRDRPDAAREHPRRRAAGPAKLLRVFLGEADKWHGEPLYDAIVKRLRSMEIAGATVYRGILGYGAKGHTHEAGRLHFSRDLPVMISVIDAPAKIEAAVAAVEEMLEDGLIVVSDVEMIRITRQLEGGGDATR
jgi:PII-like signaling protein